MDLRFHRPSTPRALALKHGTLLAEAVQFLLALLLEGPVKAADIVREVRTSLITPRTLRRAKQPLGVQSIRHGFTSDAYSLWHLPDDPVLRELAERQRQRQLEYLIDTLRSRDVRRTAGADEDSPNENPP